MNSIPFPAAASAAVLRPAVLLLAAALAAPAWCGEWREMDQAIFGMDCAPCAAGVEKGLNSLHGVRSVRVSLNEGRAVIAFDPGSRASLAQIRRVIRNNGFTPKEAHAVAVAQTRIETGKIQLEIAGERFILEMVPEAALPELIRAGTGDSARLKVRAPESLSEPPTLEFVAFAPAN